MAGTGTLLMIEREMQGEVNHHPCSSLHQNGQSGRGRSGVLDSLGEVGAGKRGAGGRLIDMAIPAVGECGRAMRATDAETFHENLITSECNLGIFCTNWRLCQNNAGHGSNSHNPTPIYSERKSCRVHKQITARRTPGGVNKLKWLFELKEMVYSTFIIFVAIKVVCEMLQVDLVADWTPFTMRSCILALGVAFGGHGPRKSALRVNRFWFQVCLRHSDSLQGRRMN